MVITILRRYDSNGSWTHDEDVKCQDEAYSPPEHSMWKVHDVIDIDEIKDIKETNQALEMEVEDLTEQNRLLTIRIQNEM